MVEALQPVSWITGAGGLIGNYSCKRAARPSGRPNLVAARLRVSLSLRRGRGERERSAGTVGRSVLGLTRPMLDLTDFPAVRERFRREKPGLIIHCAA